MTVYLHAPDLHGLPLTATMDTTTVATDAYGVEPEPATRFLAAARKMNPVDVPLASVSHGSFSSKAGGGSWLNLTDVDAAIREIQGTLANGQEVVIEVSAPRQVGWSDSRGWVPAIDKATGLMKLERGRKGRKYYVTGGPHGYTAESIAAELTAAGTPTAAADITRTWVKNSLVYGRSTAKALSMALGLATWGYFTLGSRAKFESNWLLLEKGYDYRSFTGYGQHENIIGRGAGGESPLHPLVITSYGSGSQPKIAIPELNFQNLTDATWIVLQDIEINAFKTNSPIDIVISNVNATRKGFYLDRGHSTVYRSGALNPSSDQPIGDLTWGTAPHDCGVYMTTGRSCILLENFIDQAGWRDGYNPESNSSEFPHPPTGLAHGIYLQFNFWHAIIRRNWISRSSSMSIQSRPGGTITDNVLLEANIVGNMLGRGVVAGKEDVAGGGSFPQNYGNIIFGNAFKNAVMRIYARDWGWAIGAKDGAVFDNIFMHRWNPDDPAEAAFRAGADGYVISSDYAAQGNLIGPNYVFAWNRPSEETQGLSSALQATLMQTTLQRFAATKMNLAGVPEGDKFRRFCLWMRTITPAQRMSIYEDFAQYARTPWGLFIPKRTAIATASFVPDPRTSGVLWADRVNWSTGDVPGVIVSGDSAELNGVSGMFGEVTSVMNLVDFGGAKVYEFASGKMTANALRNCDLIKVTTTGQLVVNSDSNIPAYRNEGGRLTFNGAFAGKNLHVDGQYAQVLLGPDYTVGSGKVLDLKVGPQGAVGWDGTGTASLKVASGGKIVFRAWNATTMSKLERYRSGTVGDGETEPTVAVSALLESGSIVEVDKTGLAAGTYDLTGPGVTVTNQGATLPAEVTVTGGKLVLVVS